MIPKFKNNPWIRRGIRISCKRKKELCLELIHDNDPHFKLNYVNYCKVLAEVIKETKKVYYDCIILKSNSKIKSMYLIIKK
jgi:hypothetical protein